MVIQKVILNPCKPKADGTANITGCSLLEIDKPTYEWINDMAFDKEEVKLIVIDTNRYEEFIYQEAKRLADKLEN